MIRVLRWPLPAVDAVVTAQVAALVAGTAGVCAGLRWWQALLVALALGGVLVLPVRGRTPLGWATTVIGGRAGHRARTVTDVVAADGSAVGVCADEGTVCAVIEMRPAGGSVTRLRRDGAEPEHRLPLRVLAESLTQHDISLSGIDVIAHGRRSEPGFAAAAAYDDLLGPLPAVARRTVWLVTRFDAVAGSEAAERRGGGTDGATRVVSIAAQRVVRELEAAGHGGRLLSATEIRAAAATVTGGDAPRSRTWTHAPTPDGFNTGYALDPRALDDGLLDSVWATRALSTTVTLRLRPGATGKEFLVAASCRVTTADLPPRLRRPGLTPTVGRDADALRSHVPGAPADLDALTPFAVTDADRLGALIFPADGCGQLIGSDARGRGVTVCLVAPDVAAVDVTGEPYLAQQVVLRAVATGARVVVHSDRPRLWEPLIGAVADPARLTLAADALTPVDHAVTAVVADGVEPPAALRPVTAIRVHREPGVGAGAAVSLVQPGGEGSRVVLWANGTRCELTLVTIPAETALLGLPRAAADPAPVG